MGLCNMVFICFLFSAFSFIHLQSGVRWKVGVGVGESFKCHSTQLRGAMHTSPTHSCHPLTLQLHPFCMPNPMNHLRLNAHSVYIKPATCFCPLHNVYTESKLEMPLALKARSNFLTTCLIIVLDKMKVIPIQNSCYRTPCTQLSLHFRCQRRCMGSHLLSRGIFEQLMWSRLKCNGPRQPFILMCMNLSIDECMHSFGTACVHEG